MAAPKKRLGRGLGNLISGGAAKKAAAKEAAPKKTASAGEAPASAKTETAQPAAEEKSPLPFREISVAKVVPNPYQPRRDIHPEQIRELADSIRSEGLLQPIVVRPKEDGHYELIAGERRWLAHQELGLKTVAARIINASNASSAVMSLIENLQREGLNAIEESLGYASLMKDFGLTQEGVAERVGKNRATIANALRLLQLDREIQGYIAKGLLSAGHAKALLGVEDPANRLLLARRMIESGMSVREAERQVRTLKNDKPTGLSPKSGTEVESAVITDLEKQISSKLNTKVQLKHSPNVDD